MARVNQVHRVAQRREEARKRQEARDCRSVDEQLSLISGRRGESKREIARLKLVFE